MSRDLAEPVCDLWDTYEANRDQIESVSAGGWGPRELNDARKDRIPVLTEMLNEFFNGDFELHEFKSEIDGQNKRHRLWGFKGMNGMMFFNMLYNSAGESREELADLLRSVLKSPSTESEIETKIRELEQFVKGLREEADDLRSAPRLGSIPYYISYFWQLQNPDTYPVYYTSFRNGLSDLAIWEPPSDLVDTYLEFLALNKQIRDILSDHADKEIHLWEIEHAFYYWQNREESEATNEASEDTDSKATSEERSPNTLPDSYIPPIVSILPDLARRTDRMAELAEQTGTTIESLFENRLAVCFRMIGFTVEDLGQGSGRNPDGILKYRGNDSSYAIIYDAKSSAESFSLRAGEERQFEDYINRNVRELERSGFDNVYFGVISGSFTDDAREAIRGLKIRTPIREVRLIEIDALMELLESSLRDPEFRLGPGGYNDVGVQDFFVESGILSKSVVREELGM